MPKYRKKPTVIEAIQVPEYFDNNIPGWLLERWEKKLAHRYKDGSWELCTFEGTEIAKIGDYIIRKPNGLLTACKKELFETEYELLCVSSPGVYITPVYGACISDIEFIEEKK